MFLKQCGFNDFPTKISTLLLLQSVFSCCNNVISVLSGGQLLLTFTCALTLTTQLAFHTRPMRIDIHKYRYSCNSNYQYKQVSTTLCSKYMTLLSFHPLLMCGVTVYSKRSCYTIFSWKWSFHECHFEPVIVMIWENGTLKIDASNIVYIRIFQDHQTWMIIIVCCFWSHSYICRETPYKGMVDKCCTVLGYWQPAHTATFTMLYVEIWQMG